MKSASNLKKMSLEGNWEQLNRPQAHIYRQDRYGHSETRLPKDANLKTAAEEVERCSLLLYSGHQSAEAGPL
jgi:hypothetical protein